MSHRLKLKFKKEDSVFFISFVLLAVGLYLNEPKSGSGAAQLAGSVGAAVLVGAILALIPWGIAKLVMRIMRKPSYPTE
jgi:hypothetical protein